MSSLGNIKEDQSNKSLTTCVRSPLVLKGMENKVSYCLFVVPRELLSSECPLTELHTAQWHVRIRMCSFITATLLQWFLHVLLPK
eukprot:5185060-Amphidinium_carterae.1